MKNTFLFLLLTGTFFTNCKKENRINKKMEGTWTFVEYSTKEGVVTDFSGETRTFIFSKYKKAYTQTMKGIYRVDYSDPNKLPVIDTFEYQLKGNEFDITKVQNKTVNGSKPNTTSFLKRRFEIKEYKNNVLKLVRKDSTDLYIKATK